MGTSLDPACVTKLHGDIEFACQSLENNGHESLVITCNAHGYCQMGSVKGRQYMEDKQDFIMNFVQFCQNKQSQNRPETISKAALLVGEVLDSFTHEKIRNENESINTVEESSEWNKSRIQPSNSQEIDNLEGKSETRLADVEMESDDFEHQIIDTEDKTQIPEKYTEAEVPNFDSDFNDDTRQPMKNVSVKQMPVKTVKVPAFGPDTDSAKANTHLAETEIKAQTEDTQKRRQRKVLRNIVGGKIIVVKQPNIVVVNQPNTKKKGPVSKTKAKNIQKKKNKEEPCKIEGEERRRFTCEICGKQYLAKADLTVHKRKHTGEKPFMCSKCGKQFRSRHSLRTHWKVHSDATQYHCTDCGKTFKYMSSFNRHQVLHTGERPHMCDVCGQSFNDVNNYKLHRLKHTGLRPFVCSECGTGFWRKDILINHERIHTNEFPFGCDLCEGRFRSKRTLARHKQKHHV